MIVDVSEVASTPASVAVSTVVGVTGRVGEGAAVLVGLGGGVEDGAVALIWLGAGEPHPAASMKVKVRRMSRVAVFVVCRLMGLLFFMQQV